MFAEEYIPFAPAVISAPPLAVPVAADGFERGRSAARFTRFQDDRREGRESLAALATLAAPGLPWADGLATLRGMPAPLAVRSDRWDALVWTCLQLSEHWGQDLHSAGWDTLELFGANPDITAARADRNGLAMLMWQWSGPIKICSVEPASVSLAVGHDTILRWRRFDRSHSIPMWEAWRMNSGP